MALLFILLFVGGAGGAGWFLAGDSNPAPPPPQPVFPAVSAPATTPRITPAQPASSPPTAPEDADALHKVYRAAAERIRANHFSSPSATWFITHHGTHSAASDKRLVNLLRGIYNLPGEQEHVHSECPHCPSARALGTGAPAAVPCSLCKGEITYIDKAKMVAEIKSLTDKIIRRETAFIKGIPQPGF